MPITLSQIPTVSVGDTEVGFIDLQDQLDAGELLTGTPTVVEQTTSDLTIANVEVTTAAETILNRAVAIGKAIQFRVSGFQSGVTYRLRCTVTTDTTPSRTLVRDVTLEVS